MRLDILAREAAALLGAKLEADEGGYHVIEALVEGYEENDEDRPSVRVTVYHPDEEEEQVVCWAVSGVYSKKVRLSKILKAVRETTFARVFLGEPDGDGEVRVEIDHHSFFSGLDAERLSTIVQEIVNLVDEVDTIVDEAEE